MNDERTTYIDFVAKGDSPEVWKIVLVEQGPWSGSIDDQLRRIQDRLYGCVDAALDGQLAGRFSESKGKDIVIRLDCYNVPREEVEEFFYSFSKGIFAIDDYREALDRSSFARSIDFEISFDSIH